MGNKHEHIQAALMWLIEEKLEEISRRGCGYIDMSYKGGVDYKIDGVTYHITIAEEE